MKKIDNFIIFHFICCIFIFLRLEIIYGSDVDAPFTDDFYYYLTTAKNFISLGSTTFDKISPTNGFQPLWFLIITLIYFIFQNNLIFNILIILLIFIFSFFTYLNIKKYLQKNNFQNIESNFIASLVGYLSLFFSKNGMEISLATFFFSWSLLYLNKNILIFCLLSFFTFLSRLEFLIFYFILLIDECLIKKKIFKIDFFLKILLLPTLIIFYILINLYFYGIPLPESGIAKSLNNSFAFNTETFTFLKSDGYGMRFISFLFYINCIGILFIFSKKLKRITKITLITTFIFFVSNSLRSAWPLWTWHFFFLSISTPFFLNDLFSILNIEKKRLANIVGIFFVISYSYLFYKNFNKDNDHILILAHKISQHYANSTDKIFAMGDMAGKLSYLLDGKLIQLEGLVGGKKIIERIKKEENLCNLFHDLNVDVYLTSKIIRKDQYIYVSEPTQNSKNIKKMRGKFLDNNLQIFSSSDLKIYAFDLNTSSTCVK